MVSKNAGEVFFLDSTEISMIRDALWNSLNEYRQMLKRERFAQFDKYHNKEQELHDLFDRLSRDYEDDCFVLARTIETEIKPYDSYPGFYE